MQRNVTNPLTTSLVLPMTTVPIIAAQFLWHDTGQSSIALLFFGALFIVILQRASTRHQRTAAKTITVVADTSVTPAENAFFGNQLAFHRVGM